MSDFGAFSGNEMPCATTRAGAFRIIESWTQGHPVETSILKTALKTTLAELNAR